MGQGLGGPQTWAPCLLLVGWEHNTVLAGRCSPPKKLHWALLSRVFTGILLHVESSATRLNFISCHQPPPTHQVRRDWAVITWPKVPTLWSHGWSFCSPAPSSAISVLLAQTQGWPEELVNGKDTWEILRVLEGPCWTLRTKTREVFCYPIIRII